MAPDCIANYTGLTYHNLDGSFVTNFIFIAFLLLFTIPIQVQMVTICDRLDLYKWFNIVFKKLYRTLQAVYRLYQLARECHRLHTSECRLKKTARRPRQQPTQTLPPLGEYIPALMTRPILIRYTEESPLLTPDTPKNTGSSRGLSFRRTRNHNIPRTVDTYRRPAL